MFNSIQLLELCRILNAREKHINENGCWLSGNETYYPQMQFYGITKKLSVFAAVAFLGLALDENDHVPKGIEVCHKCPNKNCWNPEHVYVGTHGTNRKDVQYDRIIRCVEKEHEIKRHKHGSLYCDTCAINTEMKRRLKLRKYLKLA